MIRALACILAGPVALGAAAAPSLIEGCDAVRDQVEKSLAWQDIAPGVSFAKVAIDRSYLGALSIVRLSTSMHRLRPFEMKQLDDVYRTAQIYQPPMYSLAEVRHVTPGAVVLASAGSTRSYSDPIPVGWLKIAGRIRGALAAKDPVLNGVVCLNGNGEASLFGVASTREIDRCNAGFQAGPMVVEKGLPSATEFKGPVNRVWLAVSRQHTFIGFATNANTAIIGCALTASKIDATSAINLQGYTLGGIAFGGSLKGLETKDQLGNVDALIATALVVEPRPQPQKRSVAPSR